MSYQMLDVGLTTLYYLADLPEKIWPYQISNNVCAWNRERERDEHPCLVVNSNQLNLRFTMSKTEYNPLMVV